MRPILVHMRVDFMPLTMDQLINHAAKWRYMFGGKLSVPLVVRAIIGRGWGSAAQHSQSLQSLFAHIPGLKVVMPSTPYDAKGLLRSSVYDGNPVIFIEHRWLYEQRACPQRNLRRSARIVRRRGGCHGVAISHMVYESIKAAEAPRGRGDTEVIDLRTISRLTRP
jgi:pyruvate dehydrogenase E1 component beta subunit